MSIHYFIKATSHSFRAILMINSSKDVFSQRLVPFGVSLIYGFYPYKVIKGCNIEAPKGKEGCKNMAFEPNFVKIDQMVVVLIYCDF